MRWAGLRFWSLVAFVALMTVLGAWKVQSSGLPDPARLRASVESWGVAAPILYVAILSLRPFLFLPGPPLMLAGGLAFGVWLGTFLTTLGLVLAALVTYGLARLLGYDYVRQHAGPGLARLSAGRLGPWLVFLMNVTPLFPLTIPNYGAGLAGVPVLAFALATAAGLAPKVLAWSTFGSAFVQPSRAGLAAASVLMVATLVVPLAMPSVRKRLSGFTSPEPRAAERR